jgi:hypothetical protein
MIRTCARETEVKALLLSGHWPHACPADLLAHVNSCRDCRGTVAVTLAFRQERAAAAAGARLEAPGVLWWRAQLRRRRQAMERIERPLLGAQVITIVLSLVAAVAMAAEFGRRVDMLQWLTTLHLQALLPSGMQNAGGVALLALIAAGVLASVAGALIYSTSDRA